MAAAQAQEITAFAGGMRTEAPRQSSYAWMISYARDIVPHAFGAVTYLNEGHVPGHHRDGVALQLGLQTQGADVPGLALRLAAGPYRYFDTEVAHTVAGYADSHDWGMLYTLAATWRGRPGKRWLYELRVDRVQSHHGFDSTLVLGGVGYRFEQDGSFRSNETPREKGGRDEIAVLAGQTIVNSFESENSTARSVEYRHDFGPVVRGSLGWINEGDARLIRRNGIVAQAWLEPTFLDGTFSLGFGLGPYVAVDAYRPEQRHNLVLYSFTASYRVSRSWAARITWHRSSSNYDRDSDILLAGVGYRF